MLSALFSKVINLFSILLKNTYEIKTYPQVGGHGMDDLKVEVCVIGMDDGLEAMEVVESAVI